MTTRYVCFMHVAKLKWLDTVVCNEICLNFCVVGQVHKFEDSLQLFGDPAASGNCGECFYTSQALCKPNWISY